MRFIIVQCVMQTQFFLCDPSNILPPLLLVTPLGALENKLSIFDDWIEYIGEYIEYIGEGDSKLKISKDLRRLINDLEPL